MDKLPFSVYDFFAYLSSGAVVLITANYVMALGLLAQKEIGILLGLAILILAYVCGQVVAQFASLLLEQILVARMLRRPTDALLGHAPKWAPLKWIFPGYFRALPLATQQRIQFQARSRGLALTGEALFLHVYAVLSSSAECVQNRLDKFRDQYGFARNMSFSLLLAAITIFVAHHRNYHSVKLSWAVLGIVGSVVLFYRYLKFFRQYTYELFLRYAETQSHAVQTLEEGA